MIQSACPGPSDYDHVEGHRPVEPSSERMGAEGLFAEVGGPSMLALAHVHEH